MSGMLEQIFFVVIVLAVGSLMAVDVARTRHEGFHGLAEGQAPDAARRPCEEIVRTDSATAKKRPDRRPMGTHPPGLPP